MLEYQNTSCMKTEMLKRVVSCVSDPQVHPESGTQTKHGEPAEAEQRPSGEKTTEEDRVRPRESL